jgi:hypothetical protein
MTPAPLRRSKPVAGSVYSVLATALAALLAFGFLVANYSGLDIARQSIARSAAAFGVAQMPCHEANSTERVAEDAPVANSYLPFSREHMPLCARNGTRAQTFLLVFMGHCTSTSHRA